jgi:acyl-CoA hydrolase
MSKLTVDCRICAQFTPYDVFTHHMGCNLTSVARSAANSQGADAARDWHEGVAGRIEENETALGKTGEIEDAISVVNAISPSGPVLPSVSQAAR